MLERDILDEIKNTKLFSELTKSELNSLIKSIKIVTYKKGDVVFAENDNSRDLFYISSGTIELYKTSEGKNVSFKKLDKGNFFGEMSFIDNSPRSAHVIASSKTSLIKFDYELITKTSPQLLTIITSKIYTLIMNRLKESNSSNVKNIEAKLDHLQFQQEFGYFFCYLNTCD